jgi:fibronectin type 3 domain-containing protein
MDASTGNIVTTGVISLPQPKFIKAGEDTRETTMTWGYVPKKMPSTLKVFRLAEGEKEYREIGSAGGFRVSGDSVYLVVKDTLVKPMMIYKYILRAFDWFGNPFPVSDTAIARSYSVYSAPVIRLFHTKPTPEHHAIRLSWPKVSGQGLRGILLFRGSSYEGKFYHLATLGSTDTSYMDVVPLANENYWYFALVANRFGYGLPSTRVFDLVPLSSNPLQPASPNLKQNSRGIEINWSYQGGIVKGYYLYRGDGYRGELRQLSGIIKPDRTLHYLDTTVIPGNAYRYAIAAMGEGSGLSPVSEPVSLMVPANGKITVPFNLRYRISQNQVMLFWENLLLNDGLVNGYVVYRKIAGQSSFEKLTAVPLSSITNSFTDSSSFSGKTVEYEVSSVDPQGIESARSSPLTIGIPGLERLQVGGVSLINDGGNIVIKWPVVFDHDIIGFRVYRFSETSEPVLINTSHAYEFTTTDHSPIKGNILNSYFVKAVFSDGTESEPGEIAGIRVP